MLVYIGTNRLHNTADPFKVELETVFRLSDDIQLQEQNLAVAKLRDSPVHEMRLLQIKPMHIYRHVGEVSANRNYAMPVFGFGAYRTRMTRPSEELREGKFRQIDSARCYREYFSWNNPLAVICLDGFDEYSVCYGDSGSPIVVYMSADGVYYEPHVVGIVVQSEGCTVGAKALAVSTAYYSDFILSITGSECSST